MKCLRCGGNPAVEPVVIHRINEKGITGEWMCDHCISETEKLGDKFHYVHSDTCPSYCDYACNGELGFELAEKMNKFLGK